MKQKLKKIAVLAVLLAAGAFLQIGNAQKTIGGDVSVSPPPSNCPPEYIGGTLMLNEATGCWHCRSLAFDCCR